MIYNPSDDSYLIEEQLKKYCSEKYVLDMGTGSGILAKSALKNGAKKVLASDINSEAIALTKKLGIPSKLSNLFSKIKGKFDLIVFNPPYLPEDKREDKESKLSTTGGKEGDEIIVSFLKKVSSHLNENGIVLLLLSSHTPFKRIKEVIKNEDLTYKKISEKRIFFENLYVLEIKKAFKSKKHPL